MQRSHIKGFTLIEILLAYFLATVIIAGGFTLYRTATDLMMRITLHSRRLKQDYLVFQIQRSLMYCSEFSLDKKGDMLTISYFTPLGMTAPYVKVRVKYSRDGLLTYEEFNPNEESEPVYSYAVSGISLSLLENDFINVQVGNTVYKIVIGCK